MFANKETVYVGDDLLLCNKLTHRGRGMNLEAVIKKEADNFFGVPKIIIQGGIHKKLKTVPFKK